MISLEDDLPGPSHIRQVSFKRYFPNKKNYLSRTAGPDFFQALLGLKDVPLKINLEMACIHPQAG